MKDKIIKLLSDWKVNEHKQELMAEELLILRGVSHRRELLLDFWMNLPKTHKHKGVAEHYIDNYLKSNNCG